MAPIAAPVRWRALPDVPGEKQSRRGSSETVEATYAAPNRADFGARSLREALRVRVASRETPERSEASYICMKAPPQRGVAGIRRERTRRAAVLLFRHACARKRPRREVDVSSVGTK